MANSLFIVDSPPLLDPHSEAKMVTCTLRDLSEKDAISKHDQNGYTPKRKQNIKNDYKKFITSKCSNGDFLLCFDFLCPGFQVKEIHAPSSPKRKRLYDVIWNTSDGIITTVQSTYSKIQVFSLIYLQYFYLQYSFYILQYTYRLHY